jgi:glyoxylase-like metal-dependent hydrolase (beta-lactamase superfamily II)
MRMIIAVAAIACAAVVGTLAAQTPTAQTPMVPTRSITHVAGDVYRFQNNGHFGVFMVTPRGVVLVDPINLDTANWVKGEIARRFDNAKVVAVLYSHHDWDHASGAAAFPDARVVSRVETVRELAAVQSREQFKDVVAPSETYDTPVKRITLGGKSVELHYVPSRHASDLSYVYFPTEKVLFVVDVIAIKRVFFRNMPGFDEPDMIAALDKAESFDTAFIVPGHGSIGTKADLQDVRRYLADLRDGVRAGIAQGRTLQQIQSELMLERYASWENYAEARALNIEGMYAYLTRK